MINFYEALRIELHPEIGVTIVFPGLIENGNTNPNPDLLAEVFYYHHITRVVASCGHRVSSGMRQSGC